MSGTDPSDAVFSAAYGFGKSDVHVYGDENAVLGCLRLYATLQLLSIATTEVASIMQTPLVLLPSFCVVTIEGGGRTAFEMSAMPRIGKIR